MLFKFLCRTHSDSTFTPFPEDRYHHRMNKRGQVDCDTSKVDKNERRLMSLASSIKKCELFFLYRKFFDASYEFLRKLPIIFDSKFVTNLFDSTVISFNVQIWGTIQFLFLIRFELTLTDLYWMEMFFYCRHPKFDLRHLV